MTKQPDPALEKARKQQYMVENIVNKGHDQDEFAKVLSQQKINGTDVDNWTLDEIKDVSTVGIC